MTGHVSIFSQNKEMCSVSRASNDVVARMKATTISSLLPSEQEQFDQQRYLLLKRLFQPAEVNFFRNHFMRVRESGPQPGDEVPLDMTHPDPLKRYPRLMMMHRWDEVALRFLLDNRLQNVLTALLQSEPFAVQTMLYFKPRTRGDRRCIKIITFCACGLEHVSQPGWRWMSATKPTGVCRCFLMDRLSHWKPVPVVPPAVSGTKARTILP